MSHTPAAPPSSARALLEEGVSLLESCEFEKATSTFAEAAAAASQEGNRLLEARAYANIASAAASRHSHDIAVEMYRKALAIFREVGDSGRVLRTLYNSALSHLHLRDFSTADTCMQEYRAGQKDSEELRRTVAQYEAAKATAQDPSAAFAVVVGGSGMPASRGAPPLMSRGSAKGSAKQLSSRFSQDTTPSMLEFGFENLRWSDVVARSVQGLESIEGVLSFIKSRAVAEDRYGKALKDVSSAGLGGGGSVFAGMLGGSRGEVRAECNTLFAGLEACRLNAVKESSRRLQFATFLDSLCEQLNALKQAQTAEQKKLLSRGKDVISTVKASVKKLGKATVRLDKARAEETDARRKMDACHDPAAPPLSDNEMKKRAKTLNSATAEVAAAEAGLQDAVAEVLANKKARDVELRNASRVLQHMDEDRLAKLVHMLRQVGDADEHVLLSSVSDQNAADAIVDSADPHSDLRLFLHNKTVDTMLRQLSAAQRAARDKARAKEAASTGTPVPVESSAADSGMMSLFKSVAAMDPFGAVAAFIPAEEEDEGEDVIPVPLSTHTRLQYSADAIRRTEDANPLVEAWVDAMFAGRGSESFSTLSPVPDLELQDTPSSTRAVTEVTDTPKLVTETSFMIDGRLAIEIAPSGDGTTDITTHVGVLFAHFSGRNSFVRCLNKQRGIQQNITVSFDRLVQVMLKLLDACEADGDVLNAKMIMILSETFYRQIEVAEEAAAGAEMASPVTRALTGGHEFAQKHITGHPIWQDQQFWEEAFYRSVREEVAKVVSEGESAGGSGVQPGSPEWEYQYRNIVFGQLGSYALNMKTFGLPPEKVSRIVTHLAVGNRLPRDMLQAMLATSMTAE